MRAINYWAECDKCGILFSVYAGKEIAEEMAEKHRKDNPNHIVTVGPEDKKDMPHQQSYPGAASWA